MESIIFEFAAKKNLICGICDSEPIQGVAELMKDKNVPFISEEAESRVNPKKIMPRAESLIVLGMGYDKKFNFIDDDIPRGNISVGAVGRDYHLVLKEILERLIYELEKVGGPFEYKIFVDNGPLVERELAKKAGLGFSGKNCCLISPELGSFFYIGYAVTDLKLAPTEGYEIKYNRCGGCKLCVEACPGGALSDFNCDYEKCVSYLTQYKGDLSESQKKSMGLSIYGCDVCQRVCPFNVGKYSGEITDINSVKPELEKIASMDKKYFEEIFKYTACGWRGKNILRRNASIAIENYKDLEL